MAKGKGEIVAARSKAVSNPVGRAAKDSGDRRLASMPLTVLLPQLSSLSRLSEHRETFEARLNQLQEDASKRAIGEREDEIRVEAEISMLQQLLHWFSIGET